MKILMIVICLSPGGAETQTLSICEKLIERGYKVKLISIMTPIAFLEECNVMGLEVISLNFSRAKLSVLGFFKYIYNLYLFKPEIIHAQTFNANILARFGKLFYPFSKIICTPNNSFEGSKRRILIYRYTDFLSNYNTNVSNHSVHEYKKVKAMPENKLNLVYNGINLENYNLRFDKSKTSKFEWVSIGRLTEQKNFKMLILSFEKLNRNIECNLTIVGEGEERKNLELLIKRLNLESRIKLVGNKSQTEVKKLLQNCDGFVLSSSWEGLPMVLLEAASIGVPAVVTKAGGNLEVYEDNISCYSVEINDIEGMTNAMTKLMNMSHEKRRIMGVNARFNVENKFEINNIVDQWESIYKLLIQPN